MDETERADIRAKLEALIAELDQLEGTLAQASAPVELDQTAVGRVSRIDAIQGQAMALATKRNRIAQRARIEAALKRLETNDYGRCIKCDEEIAPKRLAFDPAAATCIDCARGS